MKDREPRNTTHTGVWAFDAVATHIGQAPRPVKGTEAQEGTGFSVKERTSLHSDAPRDIAFYPDEQQVGISGLGFEIRLDNMQPPRPAKDGVLFQSKDNRVRGLFLKDGHIAVEVFPIDPVPERKALQSARSPQVASRKSDVADLPEEWRTPPHSAPQAASAMTSGQASESPAAVESPERQPRIKVTGFVATEPNMKPTPAGKPRVQFLVAEHPETPEGEDPLTIYHRVYTLNKTAERLQGKGIEKGKKVAVDGYVQKRTRKGKNGEEETYPVIYANTVRMLYVHRPVDY